MSAPFVKFIGVATTVASVVASDRSLYSPCNASLNNFNGNGCVHHFDFDVEAGGRPSISKKKSISLQYFKKKAKTVIGIPL
jgi:hypothetical protein